MTSQLAFDSAKQRFQNVWRFNPLDVANIPMPMTDLLGLIPNPGASVRSNTTLKIADLDIKIALGQLRYDDAEFRPRLDGKLSYTEKEGELGGAYDEQKEEWRADITLSWKIFGGFANVHQKRSDMAKLGSAELRYDDVVRIINEQFNNAWNNYVLVEKNLETLKRTVEINKEMYALTLEDFKAGNSPIIAVFGMKTTHIMSEVAYQNAQIDLLVARYQLHKVLGLVDPLFK
jgi:outer membrane protein TolC